MTACTVANPIPTVPSSHRHTVALGGLSPFHRALVKEALTAPLDCVKNDLFRCASAERELFVLGMAIRPSSTGWYHPMIEDELIGGAGPSSSVLSTQQEKHLFLRYNYARYRTQMLVRQFLTHPIKSGVREIVLWYGRVKDTRDLIARANLALVLAMAKRTQMSEVDFGELVSEGNMALLRAIEKFDVSRGFKFSTYACRAMLKAFSRIMQTTNRYRTTFPVEFEPAMERSDYQETRRAGLEHDAVDELQRIIGENRAQLSDLENLVIQSRFAINRGTDVPGMTLEEVGRIVGVTKERVRQIQNKAMVKLRATLEGDTFLR